MYPTIAEVLTLPVIRDGSPRLVAGLAGSGRRVRWVHAAEVADTGRRRGVLCPGQGPFPTAGLIPVLKGLYDDSWVVGFAAGFLIYLVLEPLSARARASGGTVLSTARQ